MLNVHLFPEEKAQGAQANGFFGLGRQGRKIRLSL